MPVAHRRTSSTTAAATDVNVVEDRAPETVDLAMKVEYTVEQLAHRTVVRTPFRPVRLVASRFGLSNDDLTGGVDGNEVASVRERQRHVATAR